jgi:pimeloyl-ACP methyl ester carboxylesterase
MLAGGPGELLVAPVLEGLASGRAALNPSLYATRDFVLVDQRGVGASRPSLDCPEVLAALVGAEDSEAARAAVPSAYAACRDRLTAAGVELSAFDTQNDADDIDMVREALGHEQVVLFGTSYGARLALQVAGRHPEGLAGLVLSSPVPAERNFVADIGSSYDRALRALDEACARRPTCAAFAPDLLEAFEATLAELADQPVEATYTDPVTGQAQQVTIDAASLSAAVHSLFYAPGGPALLPALLSGVAEGDYSALLSTATATGPSSSSVTYGVQASFLCAEEAVETPPSAHVEPDTLAARLLLAASPVLGENLVAVCGAWAVDPAGTETFEQVMTDVPTLVVTGQFDQITPPSYGEEIAAVLTNATYLEVPGVGHSPLLGLGACGLALLLDFAEAPAGDLDTSCVPTGPTFLTPEQVFGPLPAPAPAAAAPARS